MPTGQLSLAYRIKADFLRTTLIRSPTKKQSTQILSLDGKKCRRQINILNMNPQGDKLQARLKLLRTDATGRLLP